ncbi:alpha/beta fold hydrolase [Lentzea sp. NPDC060358]|uniref:alpha/beta fold hydrolase n=1 Tax=Lentzea sp. NPDC060358 TaxID=3347103 RepID=UPI00365B8280
MNVTVAAMHRGGSEEPTVFLHGFGTSKEDYADFAQRHDFTGRAFVAFDLPGCGATECTDLSAVDVPFLVDAAQAVVERTGIGRYHVVGQSLGALTALLLAQRQPGRVLSFVNIKGTLAPEDCALARNLLSGQERGDVFTRFTESLHRAQGYSNGLYSANLPHKIRREVVPNLFRSVVELADHGALLDKFLALPMPKMYVYGEECASLSYLPVLDAHGVELAEIPLSGHLPLYSNPVATWKRIAAFHAGNRATAARWR